MQPTWRQALVLIAAWLQGWRAWGLFKPFIVDNHTISPALQQSFQDFLDRCRRSVLRCILKSPSPDNNCISAWKHDLHTAATVFANDACQCRKLLCKQHTGLQVLGLLPEL